ncbi:MAG: hypothetical protein ABW061_00395, partial [Polyangiaceae bacterium]
MGAAGEADDTPEAGGDSASDPGEVDNHAAGGGGMPSIDTGSESEAGTGDVVESCAAELTEAEVVPLDMYLMVDTSISMAETISANSTKWSQVKSALRTFLRDEPSSGLGVGLQYFPLPKPNVPAVCHENSDCGDASPCLVAGWCWGALQLFGEVACLSDDDCAGFGPCLPAALCEKNTNLYCPNAGTACDDGKGTDLGLCKKLPIDGVCAQTSVCEADAYATPAREIATLPAAAASLIASLDAQVPAGNTPTGPALKGALQRATVWAKSHPDHRVVAVLATDGLPTNCSPTNIDEVGDIAADAVAAEPSIKTFVIGVLTAADISAGAKDQLNTVARAGGTDAAIIVDTSQSVADQFTAALDSIRTDPLACEFKIPEPASGKSLDYARVNVNFKQGKSSTPLLYVGALEDCDADTGGWYYDVDPKKDDPKTIYACPANCETFQA